MRKRDGTFEVLLDQCLDALQNGESVDDILRRSPEYAAKLEPLLRSAASVKDRATYEPSASGTANARARLNQARIARAARPAQPSHASWFDHLAARPTAMAGIATIAVLALTAVLVLRPAMQDQPPIPPAPSDTGTTVEEEEIVSTDKTPTPTEIEEEPSGVDDTPTGTISLPPQADGNFVFYVSDEQNDIADFESLVVTVSGIRIQPMGEGPSVEIEPESAEADLVQLQGERAQELWEGDLPEGEYRTVFVYVESLLGILAESGEEAAIKLPSGKLHLETPFSITGDDPVEFVFDITVHKTGGAGDGDRYILSPQASESGPGQPIDPVQPQDKAKGDPEDKSGKSGDDPGAGKDSAPDVETSGPGPGPGQPNRRFGEYLT